MRLITTTKFRHNSAIKSFLMIPFNYDFLETLDFTGAEGGTRTPTRIPPHDPESCASTSSATSA